MKLFSLAGVVVVTLAGCFWFGARCCRQDADHILFDLVVAMGAVICHHASTEIIRIIRSIRSESETERS
jgi:hypothetical protein